jgi:hypothetical protein
MVEEVTATPTQATLELFRGLRFNRAKFNAAHFRDLDAHCIACTRVISETASSRGLRSGFVTLREVLYNGYPPLPSWDWLCVQCFRRYSKRFGLVEDKGELPQFPKEKLEAFSKRWSRERWKGDPKEMYIKWRLEDFTAIARFKGLDVSEKEALDLFEEYRWIIYRRVSVQLFDILMSIISEIKEAKKT